jgi:hypothetical protein
MPSLAALWGSRILEAAGEALSDAEPALDTRQYEHARVRDQPTAIKGASFVPFHGALRDSSG